MQCIRRGPFVARSDAAVRLLQAEKAGSRRIPDPRKGHCSPALDWRPTRGCCVVTSALRANQARANPGVRGPTQGFSGHRLAIAGRQRRGLRGIRRGGHQDHFNGRARANLRLPSQTTSEVEPARIAANEVCVRRRSAVPVLLDHIPTFLDDLSEYISELRAGLDSAPSTQTPAAHALDRLELGYNVREIVAEYSTLRECLLELASRELSTARLWAEMPRLQGACDR